MSKIILSAFSDEYASSFKEQLAGMNEFGIKNIELRNVDGKNVADITKSEGLQIKETLKSYDIDVSAIGSPLGKIRLDGDMKSHLETAKRIFELAELLNAKFIRVFSFYAPEGEDVTKMKDAVTNALGELINVAKNYPVTLCHENEACIYGDTVDRCRELLDYFNGDLKCVFDMGNFVLENEIPYPYGYDILKKDIAYFHIKDALKEGAIVPPGKGDAKIQEILKSHLTYTDKDFFVTLEPHLQTFSGLNALVGRSFENPYKYEDAKSAFTDAVIKFNELTKF